MNHEPFRGVESNAVRILNARHPLSELGTDEGRPSIGRVYVEPEVLVLANGSQLVQVVKGTGACRPKSGTELK